MTTVTTAPAKFVVFVTYNGVTKEFGVDPHQTVQSLLEKAMNEFGIHQNRHTQALFPEQGEELKDTLSLTDAGVVNQAQLLLRASAVKGGTISGATRA